MNKRYNEQDPAPQYDPETARIRRALRAQKARRRKKMRSRRLFLLGMALILLFVLVPNLWGRAERLLYPRKYEALVDQWAETYGLDPLLVDAFIRTESGFDSAAESSAGAVGLMQLMPDTFRWLTQDVLHEYLEDGMRYDPETSIRYGACLLSRYYLRFGRWELAFAAYNAGETRVDGWLADESIADGTGGLRRIPYRETRHYVSKVQKSVSVYEKLYD